MNALIFTATDLGTLRDALLAERDVESCAVCLVRVAGPRFLVARVIVPPTEAYAERTRVAAVLRPEFVFEAVSEAKRGGFSCVFAHSHPFDPNEPHFSIVDDRGERRLAEFVGRKIPDGVHTALVISPGGARARLLGGDKPVRIVEVGTKLRLNDNTNVRTEDERFDRQIRAFGYQGQAAISALAVAIVGAGGTGSITIAQLAHLGVRKFIVVDFDPVEETNLNRLLGARPGDVGKPKVEVAERQIKTINPDAAVDAIVGDVADDAVARRLLSADVIFLCTDSHASRAIVNQLAFQYLIPTIDMGVSMSVRGGRLAYITGRVQLLAPGLPCLTCMDLLDSEQIRREMLTPEARARDPYIVGFHEPQPSVISLNGTVSSLAITMFLGLVTEAPTSATLQFYDGIRGTVRNAAGQLDPVCYTCSHSGGLGAGDTWPLPTRTI